jgi:hypothetical protein
MTRKYFSFLAYPLLALLATDPALSQVKSGQPLYVDPTEYSLHAERNDGDLSPAAIQRLRNRLSNVETVACNLRGFTVGCKYDPRKKEYVFVENIPAVPFLASDAETTCKIRTDISDHDSNYGRSNKTIDLTSVDVPNEQSDLAKQLKVRWDECLFYYERGAVHESQVRAGKAWIEWWEDFWQKGIKEDCDVSCPVAIKRKSANKIEYLYCVTDRLSAGEYRTPYTCGTVAYVDPKGQRFLIVYARSQGEVDIGGEDTTLGLRISCELGSEGELPDVAVSIKGAFAKPPISAINERKETRLLPGHSILWKRDYEDDVKVQQSNWTYWKSFGPSSIRAGWFDRYILEVQITKQLIDEMVKGKTITRTSVDAYIRGLIYATRRNMENDLRLPDNALRNDFGQKVIQSVQNTRNKAHCTFD